MASTVLTLAANGTRRGFRSRSLLLLGVVGPLVLGAVLALAFGSSGPTIKVVLVDLDGSAVSEAVAEGLSSALENSQIDLEVRGDATAEDLEAVEQRISDGDTGAALVVPEGYGESVAGAPEPLRVVGAGDNAVAASVAEGLARSVASGTDLTRAVVAGYLGAGLDPAGVLSGEQVEAVVSVDTADFLGAFDAPLYFGPLAVFLFLGLGVTARRLLRDEKDGILGRIRAAPVDTRDVVAGSSATVVVQGALASAAVILLSTLVFGATWGQPLEVAVVVAAFVVSVAGLLGLIVGVASTELQAESWTNLIAFTFAVIGGSFFGGAMMPGLLGVLGTLTPNGAAMRALIELGPGGRSLADVWYLVAWLVLVGVVGVLVGGRLLTRRLR